MTTALSPYRKAEADFANDPDGFFQYLEAHKLDDPTLAFGWAIERSRRYFNRDQAAIADRTAVIDGRGNVLEEPVSRSYVSAILAGRSRVAPQTYRRFADALEINPVLFFLAEGWLTTADLVAYELPERHSTLPIISKIMDLPPAQQARARALVLAVLDSIYELAQSQEAEKTSESGQEEAPPKSRRRGAQ